MRRSNLVRFTAVLLALMLPTSAFCGEAAVGMAHAQGRVMLNGAILEVSSAVFTGDKVRTQAESALAITLAQGTVLVPENTSLLIQENGVQVLCGSALIATARGMEAAAANLKAVPIELTAKFEITHTTSELRVTAREGALRISDGRRELQLSQGESLTAVGGCDSGTVYMAAATTRSPAPSSSSSNYLPGAAVAVIVAGIVAGVATAIYFAVRDESPSEP